MTACDPTALQVERLGNIEAVDAAVWDDCFQGSDPFTKHAFLAALERHGCVSEKAGWVPAHTLLRDASGALVAAAPAYLKMHSWGEFVFDFAWANAAEHAGIAYYPKLVCAVPFVPVSGPRLGAGTVERCAQLASALQKNAVACHASSLHALFLRAQDREVLHAEGGITRRDIQFHWYNDDYVDFGAFLASLKHDRRKKIRRERRRVTDAGLRLKWSRGEDLPESEWASIYSLYAHTYLERGRLPYLNLPFFVDYGQQAGSPLRVVSVHDGRQRVAAAIFMESGDTLYGRHWGASAQYHSLHFETCYYQGVDYCIRNGLRHFDAGAQGGHKLLRGFVPETTWSTHWFADPRLADAVARALECERQAVGAEEQNLQRYLPYRRHSGDR